MIEINTSTSPLEPKGSKFIVDRTEFKPGQTINYAVLSIPDDKILNWPMVYILANREEAYVGETHNLINRMNQHGANVEKSAFTTANVIFNEEFNESVILDYEHRLIGLMHADGKYKLTNKNDGMQDSNYFSKEKYASMFEDLWKELQGLELAVHSIKEIEESEVFKYSPFKGLTADQEIALDKILQTIRLNQDRHEPIVVEGMPGTGKTILAIYLLKMMKDSEEFKDLNIKLLEPVTSLRKTLQKTLSSVPGLSKKDVIGPSDLIKPEFQSSSSDCPFDVLLVDEAHKLKRMVNVGAAIGSYYNISEKLGLDKKTSTQMDWVLKLAKTPVFFYDPLQNIGPSGVGDSFFKEKLGDAAEHPILLESQMRVKGGKGYLDYICEILKDKRPQKREFPEYDLVLHEDIHEFMQSFEKTLQKHNLTRMAAGYAWKWQSKPGKDKLPKGYDIQIDDVKLTWNRVTDNWITLGVDNPEIAHEVGCIHTNQGYDLSYAYVIIGKDLQLDDNGNLVASKNNYFDVNGKNTASQEELNQYIKNIYYVLLTRGIFGTHIYVCDPNLRAYLKQFFPTQNS